jgi:hypothetical protein
VWGDAKVEGVKVEGADEKVAEAKVDARIQSKEALHRLQGKVDESEVELIYAGFNLETDGKVPRRVVEAADAWLRKQVKEEPRALKALSHPTVAEQIKAKKLA